MPLLRWLRRRRQLAQYVAEDARGLLARNPDTAYYDAHRAAARARFAGDAQSFWHWSRVSAEVARISENPMDIEEVERIIEEERRRGGR